MAPEPLFSLWSLFSPQTPSGTDPQRPDLPRSVAFEQIFNQMAPDAATRLGRRGDNAGGDEAKRDEDGPNLGSTEDVDSAWIRLRSLNPAPESAAG